jgi:uncharacterized protein (DUF3084 family)
MDNQLVVKRDLKLMQIDEAIQEKRRLILEKRTDIKKKSTVNSYLEGVNADYHKFYNYTVEQKQKEFKAMKTDKLMDNQMRMAKHDQKDIMNEIDKIKGEINELIM